MLLIDWPLGKVHDISYACSQQSAVFSSDCIGDVHFQPCFKRKEVSEEYLKERLSLPLFELSSQLHGHDTAIWIPIFVGAQLCLADLLQMHHRLCKECLCIVPFHQRGTLKCGYVEPHDAYENSQICGNSIKQISMEFLQTLDHWKWCG